MAGECGREAPVSSDLGTTGRQAALSAGLRPKFFDIQNKLSCASYDSFVEKYDNLIENDRVFLSDLNDDVFDLIDKSLGVCSAGGTILWEARIRGKVALNFAHAWFNAMDGIYFIKNQCDLDHGVKAILNNTTLSEIACLLFLRNYCRNSEIAAIGGKQQLEYFCLTPEENAKKHFLAIEKFFRRR